MYRNLPSKCSTVKGGMYRTRSCKLPPCLLTAFPLSHPSLKNKGIYCRATSLRVSHPLPLLHTSRLSHPGRLTRASKHPLQKPVPLLQIYQLLQKALAREINVFSRARTPCKSQYIQRINASFLQRTLARQNPVVPVQYIMLS